MGSVMMIQLARRRAVLLAGLALSSATVMSCISAHRQTISRLTNDVVASGNADAEASDHTEHPNHVQRAPKNTHQRGLRRSEAVLAQKSARKREHAQHDAADNPEGYARYRYLSRVGADGTIPPNALMRAKAQADRMTELELSDPQARDAGIWNWEWLGPGNVGGRIRSILIHPTNTNTMWIGGVSGGIWKTTNGGASWFPLNDFLPSLAISHMVMDPINSDILYAATGEGTLNLGNSDALPGAGVLKSTNGGNTWFQLADTIPTTQNPASDLFGLTNRLAIDPSNGQVLLAATRQGIFRTSDGGMTWGAGTQTFTGLAWDVDFHPTDGTKAIAGTNNGTVLSSPDGGLTWNLKLLGGPATGRVEVAYAPSNPSIIYAVRNVNDGELFRSANGAASFTQITPRGFLIGQGNYNMALWIAPDNPNVVVVGGVHVDISIDGGTTLGRISDGSRYHEFGDSPHFDVHIVVNHPNYGPSNRTVFVGTDGGIHKNSNILTATTSNWTNLANNLGITQFYGGAAARDGSVIIGGTQDNDTLRYRPEDGQQAWFQAETGDGSYCAVNFNDPSVLYGPFWGHKIQKSTDGGDSYADAVNGITDVGQGFSVAPLVMDPLDPDKLFTAGGSIIWLTTDAAATWELARGPIGSESAAALAIARDGTVWAGYDSGRVSHTTTDDKTWIDVDDADAANPLPDGIRVSYIAVNPQNSNEVWVTFGNYLSNTVWFTPDKGSTWSLRHGSGETALPNIQVNTITVHPANGNWIYVGTDIGVFASEDKGVNWNLTPRFGVHDGPANTEVAELFWQGNNFLIAATHGRGMYRVRPYVVVNVDWRNGSGTEDGSLANPFNTVGEGNNAAGHGTNIQIRAGTYDEPSATVFLKRGTINAVGGIVRIQ